MYSKILAALPEINPVADFQLTFDHFYQYVKREAGAQADQLIQIRAAAEPLALSVAAPWYSYYSYLLKMDTKIVPVPITEKSTQETFGLVDGQLSYEYGRFLSEAVRLIEIKELPPEINENIAKLEKRAENIRDEISNYVELDATRWEKYAKAMGFNVADRTAFTQWWINNGHAKDIDRLTTDLDDVSGEIDMLRLDKFKDADQEEIFNAFKQFKSIGSRLRWPRQPDNQFKIVDGTPPFTADYLVRLPAGNSPMFADRHYFFPAATGGLQDIISSTLGGFSEKLTSNSSSSSSLTTDWSRSATGGYGWFSMSVSASEHKAIKEDMKNTQSVTVSCKCLQKVPYDANPWFNPSVFNNSYVLKNPNKFARYFGPNGTLRYYPAALLIARGMKLEFESSADYSYSYDKTFSSNGNASLRVFGIGFGGGASYSEHSKDQKVEAKGHKLTLDDGENNFRVIGYIVNMANSLDKAIYGSLTDSLIRASKIPGTIGVVAPNF